MAKIKLNFNVALLDLNGDEVEQPKKDKRGRLSTENKKDESGKDIPELDKSGNPTGKFQQEAVYEKVLLKDVIGDALGNRYESDKETPYTEFVKRGNLARKVITKSLATYTHEEIKQMEEFIAKSCGVIVATHFDNLVNGDPLDEKDGAETKEKAA